MNINEKLLLTAENNQEIYNLLKGLYEETLTELNITKGVTSIRPWMFYNNASLQTVNIPTSVHTIGNNAFDGCSSLQTASFPANTYWRVENNVFSADELNTINGVTYLTNTYKDSLWNMETEPAGCTLSVTVQRQETTSETTSYEGISEEYDVNLRVYISTHSDSYSTVKVETSASGEIWYGDVVAQVEGQLYSTDYYVTQIDHITLGEALESLNLPSSLYQALCDVAPTSTILSDLGYNEWTNTVYSKWYESETIYTFGFNVSVTSNNRWGNYTKIYLCSPYGEYDITYSESLFESAQDTSDYDPWWVGLAWVDFDPEEYYPEDTIGEFVRNTIVQYDSDYKNNQNDTWTNENGLFYVRFE